MTEIKRHTKVSNSILKIFETSTQPLAVKHILLALKKKGLSPNKTTVYRLLDKLLDEKCLRMFYLKNGLRYYEFVDEKQQHHHHFFCKGCEGVFCLNHCLFEASNINTLLPNPGFSVDHHDFNLYGLCNACELKKA